MTDAEVVRGERSTQEVSGRLAMLTGLSLAVGALPLPILPDRIQRQLRGALAHDVASRFGVCLTLDAREALASPSTKDRVRTVLRKGVEFTLRRVLRRFGPLAPLGTAATAFEVYALGHLFERYLRAHRKRSTLRLQSEEAMALRSAIDESIVRAFYPSTEPRPQHLPESVEDLRDEVTRRHDTVVLTRATQPNYLERRLDAAFDRIAARAPELSREV